MSLACLRRLVAVLLFLLAMAPAGSQPLPAELFFKPADVLTAQLSPSGRRLAVTSALGGERVSLFVWDLDLEAKPTAGPLQLNGPVRRAASFSDIDVGRFWWVNDEQLVFDVIDLSEGSGNQQAPGLVAVRHDGTGLRALIARAGRGDTSRGRSSLHAGHRLLHVPHVASGVAAGGGPNAGPGGGDEVIVAEPMRGSGDRVGIRPLWQSLVSGRTRDASAYGPVPAQRWLFDTRGEARVAVTREGARQRVHWRGPGETGWRVIADEDALAPRFQPAFVDDAGTLYVTRVEGPQRTVVLARFDHAAGRPEPTAFAAVPGFDFVGIPLFGDSSRAGEPRPMVGLRVEAETTAAVWFDERLRRVQQAAEARFPGYATTMDCRRCGEEDLLVLVHAWSDRDPGHLWLYREVRADATSAGTGSAPFTSAAADPANAAIAPGRTGVWQLVSRVRTGVDPTRMARIVFDRITARDGRQIPVWVTLPPGRRAGDGGPAVVMVHGGPWVRGGFWHWDAMNQFLASRGYAVISPEFRGSAGYGAAHQTAGYQQWGRAMQDDVADAALWARRQGLADRFCIAGASYGGYATLMGLVRHPELYRCGVAWLAVTDLFLLLEGSWWVDDDIGSENRETLLPRRIGHPERDAEMLRSVSPVLQAAHIRAPLLLAYGERDLRVPLAHGQRMERALRQAGQEPEWVTYAGEGHGWLKLANRLDFARRVEEHLDRHLKPASK